MKVRSTLASLAGASLALGLVASATPALASDEGQARPLTRAEVQADLQVWRESGLAFWQGQDDPSTFTSPQYRQAMARYHDMRASPEFDRLVARYGGKPEAAMASAGR